MKIAVVHNLPSGGAKRSTYELVRELSARGHTLYEFTKSTADLDFCPLRPYVQKTTVDSFDQIRLLQQRIPLLTPYIHVLQQMLNRLRVTAPGDTLLDQGQVVSRAQLDSANSAADGAPAAAEPTIVGVSRAAVSTIDFIAAAASYGGIPTLAVAAAGKQRTQLTTTRHAAVFGKLAPPTR